jgi:hypothetical protein
VRPAPQLPEQSFLRDMNTWLGATQGLCLDGVNSAVRPDLIQPSQLAWAMNATVRDGKPRTRPALVQRAFLPDGRVQGAGYFSVGNGEMILSIGGKPYRVTMIGNNFSWEQLNLDFYNSTLLPTAWMCETSGYFIIQDGQSDPIIYNGGSIRRANPSENEVPIGRQMAYGNGRLAVAVAGHNIKVGDITDGLGSELLFTETNYLSNGGAFFYPNEITALAFLPSNNTATGYGSLMVFGLGFTDSLRLEITQRDLWSTIPGFQVVVLDNIGATSQMSVVRVNQDLYWRDARGEIRSLRSAASGADSPGNTSLSREVSRIVDFETDNWLTQSGGMFFDNRILFLASPFLAEGNVTAFNDIISLDAAPLATMRAKAPPAYDGSWNGAHFTRMVKGMFGGVERGFVISSDADGQNRLWEIEPGERTDVYLTDGTTMLPVESRIVSTSEFRRFGTDKPNQLKRLVRCDFYPAEIEGDVNVKLYWRVGNTEQWFFCDEVDFCAQMTDGTTATPHEWKNIRPQTRLQIRSFTFPQEINQMLKLSNTVGYDFQIRLVWTGNLLIDRLDVWVSELTNPRFSNISDLESKCIQYEVTDNQVTYSILP